mmetsp:Transcript_1683/g.4730  ORF Transcript_1683/g.4730 Transcript_1683/m.4730 type:complete len:246 (-) Transcript_1683:256-993(-)
MTRCTERPRTRPVHVPSLPPQEQDMSASSPPHQQANKRLADRDRSGVPPCGNARRSDGAHSSPRRGPASPYRCERTWARTTGRHSCATRRTSGRPSSCAPLSQARTSLRAPGPSGGVPALTSLASTRIASPLRASCNTCTSITRTTSATCVLCGGRRYRSSRSRGTRTLTETASATCCSACAPLSEANLLAFISAAARLVAASTEGAASVTLRARTLHRPSRSTQSSASPLEKVVVAHFKTASRK